VLRELAARGLAEARARRLRIPDLERLVRGASFLDVGHVRAAALRGMLSP